MSRPWTALVTFGITVIGLSATVGLRHPLPLAISVIAMVLWGVWLGWTEVERGGKRS